LGEEPENPPNTLIGIGLFCVVVPVVLVLAFGPEALLGGLRDSFIPRWALAGTVFAGGVYLLIRGIRLKRQRR